MSKASTLGAIKTKSASAAIRIRLNQMAKATKQGKQSFSDIARALNVTPALVCQIRAKMLKEGTMFVYDVNAHRGAPCKS